MRKSLEKHVTHTYCETEARSKAGKSLRRFPEFTKIQVMCKIYDSHIWSEANESVIMRGVTISQERMVVLEFFFHVLE